MNRQGRPMEGPERLVAADKVSWDSFPTSDPPPWGGGSVPSVQAAEKSRVVGGVFSSEDAAARAIYALRIAGFDPSREIHIIAARRNVPSVTRDGATEDPPGGRGFHRTFGAALGAAGATLTPIDHSGPIHWFASAPVIRATWLDALVGLGVWCAAGAPAEAEQCVFWVGLRASENLLEDGRVVLAEAGARSCEV